MTRLRRELALALAVTPTMAMLGATADHVGGQSSERGGRRGGTGSRVKPLDPCVKGVLDAVVAVKRDVVHGVVCSSLGGCERLIPRCHTTPRGRRYCTTG